MVESFGLKPNQEEDATLAVLQAIEHCRGIGGATLTFAEGEYHFWPDKAVERQYYVSNHDQEKTRKIAFPLLGMTGFTLDGQGATFIMHGLTTPFVIDGSSDIALKNFAIDYKRPTLSQGMVVHADAAGFAVSIPDDYPYAVRGGELIAIGEGWEEPVTGIIVMDPRTKASKFRSGDSLMWDGYKEGRVEAIGEGLVRWSGFTHFAPERGDVLLLQAGHRDCPGIFITDSRDVSIAFVDLHASAGMGVIAQKSENLRLSAFNVTPRPGSGRLFSASADACHFVNCKGFIEIENCLFENQMDDPCNVHGIYAQIAERRGDELLCRLVHPQQRGVEVLGEGDRVRLIRRDSLLPFFETTVASVRRINAEYMLVELEARLPADIRGGDAIENLSWTPNLHIHGCVAKANRARGFLITTSGDVLFEDNFVCTPGSALKLSGDANYWFESGALRSVAIRNNVFEDCNYGYPFWGKGTIDIDPEIEKPESYEGYYHSGIVIENNLFRTFHPVLLSGHSVDGLSFRDNDIERTSTYPKPNHLPYAVDLKACDNVEIDGNRVAGGVLTCRINGNEAAQPLVRAES
ncbi:alpha-1,3-galactosidase-related protein [Paenibacillus sacheonensis]